VIGAAGAIGNYDSCRSNFYIVIMMIFAGPVSKFVNIQPFKFWIVILILIGVMLL
jgi:hypothetical protein